MTCNLTLTNMGNASLESVSVSGHLGCDHDVLHPDESFSCDITTRVDQADFDHWDEFQEGVEVTVTATATPNVTGLDPVSQTTNVSVPLESQRSLAFSNVQQTGAAAKAGDIAKHIAVDVLLLCCLKMCQLLCATSVSMQCL